MSNYDQTSWTEADSKHILLVLIKQIKCKAKTGNRTQYHNHFSLRFLSLIIQLSMAPNHKIILRYKLTDSQQFVFMLTHLILSMILSVVECFFFVRSDRRTHRYYPSLRT